MKKREKVDKLRLILQSAQISKIAVRKKPIHKFELNLWNQIRKDKR